MKWLPGILIIVFLGLFFFVGTSNPHVRAETQQQIEQQKTLKQKELEKILSDIKAISSSSASITAKLDELGKEKAKLEKLLKSMSADIAVLEKETSLQEEELIDLANRYSLQQALYTVDSQKNILITLFENPSLSNVLERMVYYAVQTQSMRQQRELIATKTAGIAVKKAIIADDQATVQKSLSAVTQAIAKLENQQAQYAAALAKNYSQRNSLVSDISKLTRQAQAIINKKASSVGTPSSGVGSGSGGSSGSGSVGGATTPSTSGSISIFVAGTLLKKTSSIVRMNAITNEITLKGVWTTEYAGTLEFNKGSGMYAINELPLDQYLWGLGEMPSSWASEALKAQAIAGRSYATYKMRYGGYGKFDLYDSVQDQEYVGLSKIKASYGTQWKTAVDSTSKKVLDYGGATVQAIYSAESGGHTLSSQESPSFGGYRAYLLAKSDRYLEGGLWKPYGNGPRAYWLKQDRVNTMALLKDYLNAAIYYEKYRIVKTTSEQSASSLAAALGSSSITSKVGNIQNVVQYYDKGGTAIVEGSKYTSYLEVTGDKGKTTVTGVAFKTAYNVRSPGTNSVWSTLYDIKKVSSENWEVWSRGWGHRVGMSQYGAQGRALAGQNHETILKYYYTNANVVQYDIGRNVRVALSKVGSRVMRVTAKSEVSIYEGSTLLKKVPANTEIRIEYN